MVWSNDEVEVVCVVLADVVGSVGEHKADGILAGSERELMLCGKVYREDVESATRVEEYARRMTINGSVEDEEAWILCCCIHSVQQHGLYRASRPRGTYWRWPFFGTDPICPA